MGKRSGLAFKRTTFAELCMGGNGFGVRPGPTPEQDRRYLREVASLNVQLVKDRELQEKAVSGEIGYDKRAVENMYKIKVGLHAIQRGDAHFDVQYYKDNEMVTTSTYEPIASYGTRTFTHVPYEDVLDYNAAKKDGRFKDDLTGALRQRSLDERGFEPPVHFQYDKKLLKEEAKNVNIGGEGIINHPETGLQSSALISHEDKCVVIGFAGLNFEGKELLDAAHGGGRRQYETVREEVMALLKSGDIPRGYRVQLSGHSMGAAISQRLMYDIKGDEQLGHMNITAVNFEAPRVSTQIENFDPHRVEAHECVNINVTESITNFDTSGIGGGMGGQNVGSLAQLKRKLDPNISKDDLTEHTHKFQSVIRWANGLVKHKMDSVASDVVHYGLTDAEFDYYYAGEKVPVKDIEPAPAKDPGYKIDKEHGYIYMDKKDLEMA